MNNERDLAGLRRMAVDELNALLATETTCRVERQVSLASHTSFRIGGPASLLITVPNQSSLRKTLELLAGSGWPYLVMGLGTNLLVADAGYPGAVLCLDASFAYLRHEGDTLVAGAAVPLPKLARVAAAEGLTGLEFAAGIPGSVGGAVAMNAGAWGGEMAGVVTQVDLVRRDGRAMTLAAGEMAFAYRTSRALQERWVVTGAVFQLQPAAPETVRAAMEDLLAKRVAAQPLGAPSAGSIFKNPVNAKAGRLLDQVGAKGLRIGGAAVSEKHANFIVNAGDATAADVLALIDELQRRVMERFGVWLETEVRLVGAPEIGIPL